MNIRMQAAAHFDCIMNINIVTTAPGVISNLTILRNKSQTYSTLIYNLIAIDIFTLWA